MKTGRLAFFVPTLATAFLAACGASVQGSAPHDGSAADADATVSDGAEGPRADAGGDAIADAPVDAGDATDAGVDAAACVPACGTGKACVAGACLTAPVVLAQVPGCGAARLALSDGALFWTERSTGAVKRLALASAAATPTLVAANQMSPGTVAADEATIYWSNDGDHTIWTAPLAGGDADAGAPDAGAAPLLTAPAVVNGLVSNGGVLYYSAGASAYKVPRAGGASTTLASFTTCRSSQPVALAVAGDFLYQTDLLNQFITRERIDGTQLGNNPCVAADAGSPQIAVPETVTHTQGSLLFDTLSIVNDEVVWADHSVITARGVGPRATTTNREVAFSATSNAITGFVVTGTRVYLAEEPDPAAGAGEGTIQVAPFDAVDGGADTPTATVVATEQPHAGSFVADTTHVYWATHAPSSTAGAPDDCAIVSLVK